MDRRLRDLEIAAATGDATAVIALHRARWRKGEAIGPMQAAMAWTGCPRQWPRIPGRTGWGRIIRQCKGCRVSIEDVADYGHAADCPPQSGWNEWEPGPRTESGGFTYQAVERIQGPAVRSFENLMRIAGEKFGHASNKWPADSSGYLILDGVIFVLLPQAKHGYSRKAAAIAKAMDKPYVYKGQHRFKIECPMCAKLFGPKKFIQHVGYSHKEVV